MNDETHLSYLAFLVPVFFKKLQCPTISLYIQLLHKLSNLDFWLFLFIYFYLTKDILFYFFKFF